STMLSCYSTILIQLQAVPYLVTCYLSPFFSFLSPFPPALHSFPNTTLFRSLLAFFFAELLFEIIDGLIDRGISFCHLGVFLQIGDRKSTRLNSSHVKISYAVFCLKKKKNTNFTAPTQHLRPASMQCCGQRAI